MYDWTIDYIALGVYLIGVTVIGALTARRVSSASTFFMGERRIGWTASTPPCARR